MKYAAVALCAGFLVSLSLSAQEAPPAFAAPLKAESLIDAAVHPIPQQDVAAYLEHLTVTQAYSVFQGQNEVLAAESKSVSGRRLHIGENFAADLVASDLFTDTWDEDGFHMYLGAVTSLDAEAVRLRLDLTGLNPGDELYILDATLPRAHGPYTVDDDYNGGWWTATVEGDMAAVLVRTTVPGTPQVSVIEVAHHFLDLETVLKQVVCNNLIACEGNATIQALSSAIGRYAFSTGFSSYLCSGSLINNPNTEALEPYFLTANHCVSTQSEVASMEVFWDYRIAACGGGRAPSLGSLLRSDGFQLLATSATYDGSLVRLNNVASGAYGRAYLGWTATPASPGNPVIGIHHPGGSHMRISYGDVTAIDRSASGYQGQTRVEWFDGVTEGGSSGSPLMLDSGDFRVIGMLSNGAVHVCPENPSANYDNYASFANFFPSIDTYLTGTSAPPAVQDPENPDPSDIPVQCPANLTLKDYPALLKSLRGLRDSGLLETSLGQAIIAEYYKAAPGLAAIVSESDAAKGLFLLGAGPASQLNDGEDQAPETTSEE